ncbi:MAG: glycoside hydrolase family 3 C-terminal domain-containing protein [Bacteroidetes bacterium]|nr:glycoside hydrolase family 3 C-terminal domain-containing protein [Bacteroidota bacterium]MCL6102257.1 glycoside hydrolase family 3 C-terminal domain-containing protein [Bacteroidota bacterium]
MKKSMLISVFTLLTLIYANGQTQSSQPLFRDTNLSTDQRVEDLVGRLTLEEKVTQMMDRSPAIERLGIPAYNWWNEALHGVARTGLATVFPQAIALAATFDETAMFETFTVISDEARAKYHNYQKDKEFDRYKGLTFWTPNINIFRDPRWGRGMETYGEDPFLTAKIGVAAVKGLQGNDPKYFKSFACAKHFAVHSGPESSRHSFNAVVSDRDLWQTYLPAFEALVKEGNVQQVMCAYNSFEGKPCCGSDRLLVDILRNKWGYKGIVVSDCGAIDDFYKIDTRTPRHDTHPDAQTASADAVQTGTDVECGSSYKSLVDAVHKGLIKESELDVSLRRLFRGRFELGMFDPDEMVRWSKIPYSTVDCQEHKDQALKMARESMVLLKNKNNTLPLSKKIKTIAVVGPNANDSTMLWANYNGFPSKTITILQGIKNKLPNARIIFEKGCNHTGEMNPDSLKLTVSKVKDADIILFAGGISPKLEGEEMRVAIEGFKGGDRTNIEIPTIQKEMIKALKATGKPVIYVLCTGSALALNWEEANVDAILNAWYGGEAAGTAVADILFGDYNPAGKLPVTFYKSINQLPEFEDYSMKGRTYRYMTQEPLYPFGYGLSYTKFAYQSASLSKSTICKTENVTLTVAVKNNGKRDGDEVVQVYLRNPNDPNGPLKALKGFKRVSLKKGELQKVSFVLAPETFNSFNDNSKNFEVLPGKYELLYGGSSADKSLKKVDLEIQ